MDQKCDRMYPNALLENNDSEQRLEKKLKDVSSFNNHISSIKDMISYFKDEDQKSNKRYKSYKTLNTKLESVDTIVIIGGMTTSIALKLIGIGLIVSPISAGIACTLSLGNKVLHEIIINKYNKNNETI